MRKLAGMLDVPVTYLCDVEKNRCGIKDKLALLAEIFALSDEEKNRMFDLAGNASVDTDLSGYEKSACSLIEDSKNGGKGMAADGSRTGKKLGFCILQKK